MRARLLLPALLAAFLLGCGGDRERGINRDADRPRSATPPSDGKDKEPPPKEKAPAAKDKA